MTLCYLFCDDRERVETHIVPVSTGRVSFCEHVNFSTTCDETIHPIFLEHQFQQWEQRADIRVELDAIDQFAMQTLLIFNTWQHEPIFEKRPARMTLE